MAGQVNSKFVVFLVTGVTLLAAGVMGTAYLVLNKTGDDWAAAGDEAMAAGDFEEAVRTYGRALGHEPTNLEWLEKWASAIEQTTPGTEREYGELFAEYQNLLQQIARVDRGDFAATERALLLTHELSRLLPSSRDALLRSVRSVTETLTFFETGAGSEKELGRLRRYRGLLYARIAETGALTDEEKAEAVADLRAAINADPADAEAAGVLALLIWADAREELSEERLASYETLRDDALGLIDSAGSAAPGSVWTTLYGMVLTFEVERAEILTRVTSADGRREALGGLVDRLRPELEEAADRMIAAAESGEEVSRDPTALGRLQGLERLLDPTAALARSRQVIDTGLEQRPDDAYLLYVAARLASDTQSFERSIALCERVEGLAPKPLSVAGLMQWRLIEQATLQRARDHLRIADSMSPSDAEELAERDAAIAASEEARRKYESLAGTGSPQLLLLEGLARAAEDELGQALPPLKEFNRLTQRGDPDGLWAEGRVSQQLGRLEEARATYERLLEIRSRDVRAVLALAELEAALARTANPPEPNLRRSVERFEQGLALGITGGTREQVERRIAELELQLGDREADDPVVTVLLEARRLQLETEAGTADPGSALALLERAYSDSSYPAAVFTNGDPRLAREVVRQLLSVGRLDEAKGVLSAAAAEHPDDVFLSRLSVIEESDTLLDAQLALIDETELEPAASAARRFAVLRRAGRAEEAEAALRAALEAAPEDPTIIELAFNLALGEEAFEEAERLAERAAELDADTMGGLSFRARLASERGDDAAAAGLLSEAVEGGAAPIGVYRLLAVVQQRLGRQEAALGTLRDALTISQSDAGTINLYVTQLTRMGRVEEALAEATRLRPFAVGNAGFRDRYLSLLSAAGDESQRGEATRLREERLASNPADRGNRAALAELYVRAGRWDEARGLIDGLREEGDGLALVQLDARWYAGQGRVERNGAFVDGVDAAVGEYVGYITANESAEAKASGYLALAGFLMQYGRWDRALRAIEEAKPFQDTALMAADRLEGDLWMRRNRYEQAAAAFERVLSAGADSEAQEVRRQLVNARLLQGDFDAARAAAEGFSAEQRESTAVVLQRADLAFGEGRLDEALRLIDQVIQRDPGAAVGYVKRAQYLLTADGRLPDALADLQTALEIDPDDWRTRRIQAAAFFRRGDEQAGLESLRRAVELNPNLDQVLIGLMVELVQRGREPEALRVALDALERRPSDISLMIAAAQVFSDRAAWPQASVLLGRAWEASRAPGVAVGYAESLVNESPPRADAAARVIEELGGFGVDIDRDASVLNTRALIESSGDRMRRARSFLTAGFAALLPERMPLSEVRFRGQIEWYERVRRVFRDQPEGEAAAFIESLRGGYAGQAEPGGWLRLHSARLRLADAADTGESAGVAGAEADLQRLAADGPSDLLRILAHKALGTNRYQRGAYETAAAAWRAGLEAFPEDWEMTNNLAYAVGVDLGRPEEGLPLAQRAVELDPGRALGHNTLARILIDLGRFEDADEQLRQAEAWLRDTRTRVTVSLNQARVALGLGDEPRARTALGDAEGRLSGLPELAEEFGGQLAELKARAGMGDGAAGGRP